MFDLSKFSLNGKVAIVTGGSRGIGKEIALVFAKNDLEIQRKDIKEFGGEALALKSHLRQMSE